MIIENLDNYIYLISTEGALRLPMTYDNHPNPIPFHPYIRPTYISEYTKQA